MEPDQIEMLQRLGVALALGLLIGAERGWQGRLLAEGQRVAGLRTFGLMGLLGGLWALIALRVGELVLATAFGALAAVLVVAQYRLLRRSADVGATTMVAALVTFALGALAGFGELAVAASGAVIVTLLLGVKPQLHGLVARLEYAELLAVIKLLLMSVVLLPVLPDQGYGPWNALNPYRIWWMVVLIASISFAGYMAIKLAGARRGVLLTGAFGGLASSTATAISLARMGKGRPELHSLFGAGVVVASATMFPRMLLIGAVVAPALALQLVWPLVLAAGAAYAAAALLWRRGVGKTDAGDFTSRNPFELSVALQFGLLLAAILLLSYALHDWFGEAGLYLLALVSGLSDVDAITLSYGSRVAEGDLPLQVAARALVVAAAANTAVKAGLVVVICGGGMAWRVGLALALALGAAAGGLLLPAPGFQP